MGGELDDGVGIQAVVWPKRQVRKEEMNERTAMQTSSKECPLWVKYTSKVADAPVPLENVISCIIRDKKAYMFTGLSLETCLQSFMVRRDTRVNL